MSFLTKIFGDANAKELKRLELVVRTIGEREKHIEGLSDDRLRQQTKELRDRVSGDPLKLQDVLSDAFAMAREAAKRTLSQRHFDVQLIGGLAIHEGKIAEMRTGEGKTLVATAPVFLNALTGRGVHVVTVNDYLAMRDAVWMGPIYHLLGMTVGSIQHDQAFLYEPNANPGEKDEMRKHLRAVTRKEAYAADITYGTNNEFGFDYLRDNMVPSLADRVQRGHAFAIVDEIDSILIDEARTPLIISAPAEQAGDRYYQFARIVATLEENADYNVDEKMRAATLTSDGIAKVEKALGVANIYEEKGIETVHHVEQALKARTLFQKDRDYVVQEGEIIIVDEFTGRLMHGRRYSEGLHQAIEAKEGVEIKQESVTMATVTFQNYFRMYDKLSGMTGTAATSAEEFSKIYDLDVLLVPTNKPMVREDAGDVVYKTERGKLRAIIAFIKELHAKGQPVLLGTISIEKNELVADLLSEAGIPFEVLNAKHHEQEAKVIAQAGRKGAVTLATNIAGRGVDIVLGGTPYDYAKAEEVKQLGGLFVLGTERHEARRIDDQLRGRSGRQGDPGASQFFVSLEDDLMRIFATDRMKAALDRVGLPEDVPITNVMVTRAIESAQKKVEGHNFDIRKHLVEYDDVINKHREVIYDRREHILETYETTKRLRPFVLEMIEKEVERVVSFHTSTDDERTWNIEEIYQVVATMFPIDIHDRLKLEDFRDAAGTGPQDVRAREAIIQHLTGLANKAYDALEAQVGNPETVGQIERAVVLRSMDTLWVEHIDHMDHLRRGIGLRGYGQRDPLVEYQKEAFEMFQQLTAGIEEQVVYSIFKVGSAQRVNEQQRRKQFRAPDPASTSFTSAPQVAGVADPRKAASVQSANKSPDGKKIGRNDPCWCGSGKKYKKCHGA